MLEAEYAFGQSARASVHAAFLEYLAEDSIVLAPAPVPGRALYAAAKDNQDKLEWYPTIAEVAPSGDLGFTTGPWIYSMAAGGARSYGDFLTLWRRDPHCRWRVAFDGGVSHEAPAVVEAKLQPDHAPADASEAESREAEVRLPKGVVNAPGADVSGADAPSRAREDFQRVAQEDGFAAALRTYARNGDFRLDIDGRQPMDGAGVATRYLASNAIAGSWKEYAAGRSADSTLTYSVGQLVDAKQRPTHAYVEIWQYDAKVANWGLRVLLLSVLPAAKG